MNNAPTVPAKVVWHFDEEEPPEDWSAAIDFPTLREAIEAIVNGVPLTGHPWIRCGERVFAPHEIEALWEGDQDDPTR